MQAITQCISLNSTKTPSTQVQGLKIGKKASFKVGECNKEFFYVRNQVQKKLEPTLYSLLQFIALCRGDMNEDGGLG